MRRLFLTIVVGALAAACNTVSGPGDPPDNQTPATLALSAGDGQTAQAGQAVLVAPSVRVTDAGGDPVAGVSVSFTVQSGGGSVTGSPATTGTDGVAAVGSWTLGSSPGTNELRAEVGALTPVTFTATGTGGFQIELRYQTGATAAQQQAFNNAAARWQGLVIGDLPDVQLTTQAGQCGSNSPAINETVDDVIILVTIEPIDGPGGVLGSAGPCFVRIANNLPILGQMTFDSGDLTVLETSGDLGSVILHEMGHVLGVGTLWTTMGLLADPSQSGGQDPHFTGALAVGAFDDAGGTSYSGAKVPVEDTGGAGTADGHWRESVMDTELMTGFLDPGRQNPLSAITVASLEDMGYTVSNGGADGFSMGGLTAAGALSGSQGIAYGDDIWRGPIYQVDTIGQVIRVVRP